MGKRFIKAIAACAVPIAILFTGCIDLGGSNDDKEGKIDLGETGNKISAGETLTVKGTVEGNGPVTISPKVVDNFGESLKATQIQISFTAKPELDDPNKMNLETDAKLKLETFAGISQITCKGTYTLNIKVGVDGFEVEEISHEFSVDGPECNDDGSLVGDLTSKKATLGAQEATAGSAIDLDTFKAYTKNEAADKAADIDLFYHALSSSVALFHPKEASGYSFYPKDWSKKNETKFYQSNIGDNFEKIKSKFQISWDDNATIETSSKVNEGDVFAVKTDKGAVVLLKVDKVTGTLRSSEISVTGLIAK